MAEKKENNSEKKGIAAWLELPEARRKRCTSWLRNNAGGFSAGLVAADALEELLELQEHDDIEDDKGDLRVSYTTGEK